MSSRSSGGVTLGKDSHVARKLRGLFRKSPSDSSIPSTAAAEPPVAQRSVSQRPIAKVQSVSTTRVDTKAAFVSDEPSIVEPAQPTSLATTTKVDTPEDHVVNIWRLAYDEFKTANPVLFTKCSALFEDAGVKSGQQDNISDNTNITLEASNRTALALDRIEALQTERAVLHQRSKKFRKFFEETMRLIVRAKDAIMLAAAADPCAGAACAAVGLLLPLFLASTEENEAAVEGLNFVTILIMEYQWKERSYIESDSSSDFINAACKVYVAIYEYEAELYDHLQHNRLRRFGSNIYSAGRWKEKIETLQTLDSYCRKLTDAIAEARAQQWKNEERKWQEELLSQPRLEAEKLNRRHLYCPYESAKNANPIRTAGTLEWFLKHPQFLGWRASQSSQILWLVTDPGYGKSVLSKCLADRKGELSTITPTSPLMCYFFFQEEKSDLMGAATAVKAMLHQMLVQRPELYKHAARDFEEKSIDFLDDFEALWSIFAAICRDSDISEIVCVLDGLDRCTSSGDASGKQRLLFARKLTELYESLRATLYDDSPLNRKFFVSSRPDIGLDREFRAITIMDSDIRLTAEGRSIQLQLEIDVVIAERLRLLGQKLQLTARVREALTTRLSAMEHRSYLWLKLVFEFLEDQVEITAKSVPKLLAEMPNSVNQAYASLLSKVTDPARSKQMLQYVLATTEPLSLGDLNVLMHIDDECRSIDDLELWPETAVEGSIRSISGLLVTIFDLQAHFIHQTVRMFLTQELEGAMQPFFSDGKENPWKGCIDEQESASVLMQACITFLSMDFKNKQSTERTWLKRGAHPYAGSANVTLFTYASTHWIHLFKTAANKVNRAASERVAKTLFDPSRVVFKLWLGKYTQNMRADTSRPRNGTGLMWAAYLGLESVVEALLADTPLVDEVDSLGRTALAFAAQNGHTTTVNQLLAHKATLNIKDWVLQTPFILAVQSKNLEAAKILLTAGSSPTDVDVFGKSAISYSSDLVMTELGLNRSDDKQTGYQSASSVSKTCISPDYSGILEAMRKYIIRQHESKIWQPEPGGILLRNVKSMKSTGLSTLYDNVVQATELLELQDGMDHSNDARYHTLSAFTAFPAMIETESPLLLSYIPRILAYLWSHKQPRLASAIAGQLKAHSESTYDPEHPLTTILTHISELIHEGGADFDMYGLARSIFETLSTTWTNLLGASNPHVIYVTHVWYTIQTWYETPASLISSLSSLAETAVAVQGPASYAALQIKVDLAEIHLKAFEYTLAQEIAMDVCKQIVTSLDGSSEQSTSLIPRAKPDQLLPVPSRREPQKPGKVSENPRIIHFFLQALHTSAEANFQLGHVSEAEDEHREVLITSSSLLGVMHARTKVHRRSLAKFLKQIGKEAEADEIAYCY